MDELMTEPPKLGSEERRKFSRIQVASSTRSNSLEVPARRTPPINSSRSSPVEKSRRRSPKDGIGDELDTNPHPTPSMRPGLRLRNAAPKRVTDPMDEVMKPLTDEERRDWKGWVELESDPALFNFILRQYGVKDVKVQEGLGFDDDLLAFLPKPVYGLIFLFKYREEEEEVSEEAPKCPKHIWFANQTITNACATIALLNIVMNVEEIDLGEALTAFKSETRKLKPAYRGQRLGQDDFIRSIHNSFVRRMDVLNADLALLNEMEKWQRAQKNPKKRGIAAKPKKKTEDDDEAGFHFIAYVPVRGEVWRLDGLQRQPLNLGKYEKDWMAVARDNMLQKIAENHQDDQYNLLSLCKSPLLTIPQGLAENIRSLSAVESDLTVVSPDWRQFLEKNDTDIEMGPTESYGLSTDIFDKSNIPGSARKSLNRVRIDPSALMDLRTEWTREQDGLRIKFMDEAALIGQEDEQAARRKHDNTPIIYNSIKILAEEGVLKEVVQDIHSG